MCVIKLQNQKLCKFNCIPSIVFHNNLWARIFLFFNFFFVNIVYQTTAEQVLLMMNFIHFSSIFNSMKKKIEFDRIIYKFFSQQFDTNSVRTLETWDDDSIWLDTHELKTTHSLATETKFWVFRGFFNNILTKYVTPAIREI